MSANFENIANLMSIVNQNLSALPGGPVNRAEITNEQVQGIYDVVGTSASTELAPGMDMAPTDVEPQIIEGKSAEEVAKDIRKKRFWNAIDNIWYAPNEAVTNTLLAAGVFSQELGNIVNGQRDFTDANERDEIMQRFGQAFEWDDWNDPNRIDIGTAFLYSASQTANLLPTNAIARKLGGAAAEKLGLETEARDLINRMGLNFTADDFDVFNPEERNMMKGYMPSGERIWNVGRVLTNLSNFAGDVATDPLTYLLTPVVGRGIWLARRTMTSENILKEVISSAKIAYADDPVALKRAIEGLPGLKEADAFKVKPGTLNFFNWVANEKRAGVIARHDVFRGIAPEHRDNLAYLASVINDPQDIAKLWLAAGHGEKRAIVDLAEKYGKYFEFDSLMNDGGQLAKRIRENPNIATSEQILEGLTPTYRQAIVKEQEQGAAEFNKILSHIITGERLGSKVALQSGGVSTRAISEGQVINWLSQQSAKMRANIVVEEGTLFYKHMTNPGKPPIFFVAPIAYIGRKTLPASRNYIDISMNAGDTMDSRATLLSRFADLDKATKNEFSKSGKRAEIEKQWMTATTSEERRNAVYELERTVYDLLIKKHAPAEGEAAIAKVLNDGMTFVQDMNQKIRQPGFLVTKAGEEEDLLAPALLGQLSRGEMLSDILKLDRKLQLLSGTGQLQAGLKEALNGGTTLVSVLNRYWTGLTLLNIRRIPRELMQGSLSAFLSGYWMKGLRDYTPDATKPFAETVAGNIRINSKIRIDSMFHNIEHLHPTKTNIKQLESIVARYGEYGELLDQEIASYFKVFINGVGKSKISDLNPDELRLLDENLLALQENKVYHFATDADAIKSGAKDDRPLATFGDKAKAEEYEIGQRQIIIDPDKKVGVVGDEDYPDVPDSYFYTPDEDMDRLITDVDQTLQEFEVYTENFLEPEDYEIETIEDFLYSLFQIGVDGGQKLANNPKYAAALIDNFDALSRSSLRILLEHSPVFKGLVENTNLLDNMLIAKINRSELKDISDIILMLDDRVELDLLSQETLDRIARAALEFDLEAWRAAQKIIRTEGTILRGLSGESFTQTEVAIQKLISTFAKRNLLSDDVIYFGLKNDKIDIFVIRSILAPPPSVTMGTQPLRSFTISSANLDLIVKKIKDHTIKNPADETFNFLINLVPSVVNQKNISNKTVDTFAAHFISQAQKYHSNFDPYELMLERYTTKSLGFISNGRVDFHGLRRLNKKHVDNLAKQIIDGSETYDQRLVQPIFDNPNLSKKYKLELFNRYQVIRDNKKMLKLMGEASDTDVQQILPSLLEFQKFPTSVENPPGALTVYLQNVHPSHKKAIFNYAKENADVDPNIKNTIFRWLAGDQNTDPEILLEIALGSNYDESSRLLAAYNPALLDKGVGDYDTESLLSFYGLDETLRKGGDLDYTDSRGNLVGKAYWQSKALDESDELITEDFLEESLKASGRLPGIVYESLATTTSPESIGSAITFLSKLISDKKSGESIFNVASAILENPKLTKSQVKFISEELYPNMVKSFGPEKTKDLDAMLTKALLFRTPAAKVGDLSEEAIERIAQAQANGERIMVAPNGGKAHLASAEEIEAITKNSIAARSWKIFVQPGNKPKLRSMTTVGRTVKLDESLFDSEPGLMKILGIESKDQLTKYIDDGKWKNDGKLTAWSNENVVGQMPVRDANTPGGETVLTFSKWNSANRNIKEMRGEAAAKIMQETDDAMLANPDIPVEDASKLRKSILEEKRKEIAAQSKKLEYERNRRLAARQSGQATEMSTVMFDEFSAGKLQMLRAERARVSAQSASFRNALNAKLARKERVREEPTQKIGTGRMDVGNGMTVGDALSTSSGRFMVDSVAGGTQNLSMSAGAIARSKDTTAGVVVKAGDPEYFEAVARFINRMLIRPDGTPHGMTQIVIKGGTVDDLVKFLKETPEGIQIQKELGIGGFADPRYPKNFIDNETIGISVEEYAKRLHVSINDYIPDGTKASILRGEKVTGAMLRETYKDIEADLPDLVGLIDSPATLRKEWYEKPLSLVQQANKYLSDVPNHTVFQVPIFRGAYRTSVEDQFDAFRKLYKREPTVVEVNAIEKKARNFALKQTRKYTYNVMNSSRLEEGLRILSPFMAAQVWQIKSLAWAASENPGRLVWLMEQFNKAQNSLPWVDRNGNKTDGPTEGGAIILKVSPQMEGVLKMIPGVGDALAKQKEIKISPRSLDPIFAGEMMPFLNDAGVFLPNPFMPSTGPIVGIGMSELLKKSPDNKLLQYLNKYVLNALPYGPSATPGSVGLAIPGRPAQLWLDQRFKTGDWLDVMKDVIMQQELLFTSGKISKMPSPDELTAMTNELYDLKFATSIFSPVSVSFNSEAGVARNIWRQYQDKYGEEAYQRFIIEHPDLIAVTQSASKNPFGVDYSVDSFKELTGPNNDLYKSILGHSEDAADMLPFLINLNSSGEFSPEVYASLKSMDAGPGYGNYLQAMSPIEIQQKVEAAYGWADWKRGMDKIDAMAIEYGLNESKDKKWFSQMKGQLREAIKQQPYGNAWFREFGNINMQKFADRALALETALSDPKWMESNAGNVTINSISLFLSMRNDIKTQLQERLRAGGSGTLAGNDDLEALYITSVDALKKQDIAFAEFYNRYFEGDRVI